MTPTVLAAFLALVAVVVVAFLAGVWSACRGAPARGWILATAALGAAAWLGVSAALARSGVLGRFEALPPPAALFLAGLTAATVGVAMSPLGGALARRTPLAALVGVQAFRAPLEVLLHRLYVGGVLPVQVTYAGWNVDVATGVLAAALGVALWRGAGRRWVAAWNALGLVLLAVVVGTAALSLPTPVQLFEPSTAAIVTFPLVWLPAVLVQGALLGHLLVIRRLRSDAAHLGNAPRRSGVREARA